MDGGDRKHLWEQSDGQKDHMLGRREIQANHRGEAAVPNTRIVGRARHYRAVVLESNRYNQETRSGQVHAARPGSPILRYPRANDSARRAIP
jgi:hypothetical protein